MALDTAVLSLRRGAGCFVEAVLQGLVYHSDLDEESVGHARVMVQVGMGMALCTRALWCRCGCHGVRCQSLGGCGMSGS